MFTGIVEEMGIVKSLEIKDKTSRIKIEAEKVLQDTKLGDSISTNGVCLTVTNITDSFFEADIMGETLSRSNLGQLKNGSRVNLERALTLSSRLGGHIVSGHIDGEGEIDEIRREDISIWIGIKCSNDILRYVVEKGSIAIDGISLTVAYVDEKRFKVSIIPHTGEETTLTDRKVGDKVNLECDVVGKYIEKLISVDKSSKSRKSNITEEFLSINGFI